MKLLHLLVALLLASLALASPAAAQTYAKTYTQVSNTSFSSFSAQSAAASPGASQIAATGWIDVSGNCWESLGYGAIDPIGGSTCWNNVNTWNLGLLARSETAINQRVQIDATWYNNNVGQYALLRYRASANGSNGYVVGLTGTGNNGSNIKMSVFKVVDGTLTYLQDIGSGVTFYGGDSYTLSLTIEQTNSTTSTLSGEITHNGTHADGGSMTDSEPSLQGYAGQPAVFQHQTSHDSQPITGLRTYSGDPASSATSYTLTGPGAAIVGQASSPFTVAPSGQPSSSVTVTPSDGAGGTFTPATVTFASGSAASQTFAYTPASAGSKTVATTNNGGLTNPAGVTLTAVALTTVPVSSASFHYSPLNWTGDTGRGGSQWRSTWNPGAYLEMQFTTSAAASPTANMIFSSNSSTSARVHFYLNGKLYAYATPTGSVALGSYLQPNTAYRLLMVLDRSDQTRRWNYDINAVRVMGFQVDTADVFTTLPNQPWVKIVGDSISEGVGALTGSNGATDNVYDYTFEDGQALRAQGYDYCVSANGGSGFLRPGDSPGDVPAFYSVSGGTYSDAASRWNKVDQGVSTLDANGQESGWGAVGQQPAAILVNYNYNEAIQGSSLSDLSTSIQGWLAAERAVAPAAQIIMLVPPGLRGYANGGGNAGAYADVIGTATSAYLSAHPSDTKTSVVDLGIQLANTLNSSGYVNSDLVHPNTLGHATLAPRVLTAITSALTPAVTTAAPPRFRPGFH